MMPLTFAERGTPVSIRKITGRDDIRQRLAELGFVVGEQVSVVSRMGGDMILCVKGTRIALSQSMAARILV